MTVQGPNRYRLKLKNRRVVSVDGRENGKFRQPDTAKAVGKIYVVKSGADAVYVGSTVRPIRERLRAGLKGRYAYPWSHLKVVELLIWCFANERKKRTAAKRVEAVEAEVVYLFRESKDRWPQYQTETLFHNDASGHARATAKEIFDIIRTKK